MNKEHKSKKAFNLIMTVMVAISIVLSVQYFGMTRDRYSVSGAGEGSIMLDKITGRTWILELKPMPLVSDHEFIGPNKIDYIWTPASVKPAYSSVTANTPGEAIESEQAKLNLNHF